MRQTSYLCLCEVFDRPVFVVVGTLSAEVALALSAFALPSGPAREVARSESVIISDIMIIDITLLTPKFQRTDRQAPEL